MEYCDGGYVHISTNLILDITEFLLSSCMLTFINISSVLDVMQVTNSPLTEQQIGSICYHILKGLSYMHSHKILHRDIKAGNVLITNDGKAKLGTLRVNTLKFHQCNDVFLLADFGVSTKLMTTIQKHKTVVGSPYGYFLFYLI